MIETDQQRRWWFATHPEYSGRRSGRGNSLFGGKSGNDSSPQQSTDLAWERFQRAIEEDKKGLIADPHTALDLIPIGRALKLLAAPKELAKYLLKQAGRDVVVSAAKKSADKGPGKWVEVRRGKYGLEHQSKMSGQPIRESGGKYHINEYEVNGVKFDDYRDGVLYEYKGNYSNFILRKAREFYQWFKGAKSAREQARRQADAAQGVPVKWRVGPQNQVKAFKKAVGKVPGVTIEQ